MPETHSKNAFHLRTFFRSIAECVCKPDTSRLEVSRGALRFLPRPTAPHRQQAGQHPAAVD